MRISDIDLSNTGLNIGTVNNILTIGGLIYLKSRLNLVSQPQLIHMTVKPLIANLGYNELEQSSINGVTVIKYGLGKQVKRITICTETDIENNKEYALQLLHDKLLTTTFRPIAKEQIDILRQCSVSMIYQNMALHNCLNAVYVDSNNYLYLAYNNDNWCMTVSASGLSNVASLCYTYLTRK